MRNRGEKRIRDISTEGKKKTLERLRSVLFSEKKKKTNRKTREFAAKSFLDNNNGVPPPQKGKYCLKELYSHLLPAQLADFVVCVIHNG